MGIGGSKDAAKVAGKLSKKKVEYQPPFGAPNPENPHVFFDVEARAASGRQIPLGRFVVELKADVVPKTAENFRQLACKAKPAKGYRDTEFHRVIPGFMCQGGDYTKWDGRGGKSIYGRKFEDENFDLKHSGKGVLSMANSGPNTNGSQFFLCVAPTPWLNNKHVVFGQVVEGWNVVKAIESCGTQSGVTCVKITVANCGELCKGEQHTSICS